jgi:hypothetical protein
LIVTCDAQCNMGYIYLQQPKEDNPVWMEKCSFNSCLEGITPEIPYIAGDKKIQDGLTNLILSEKTYLEDLNVEFEEEYLNDKDNRYITGIELNLGKKELINLIKDKAFKLHETEYLGRKFLCLLLDYLENVLDPSIIIYPANSNMDVFYVVSIEDGICYFKAVIFAKESIYNAEYLTTPMFILYE